GHAKLAARKRELSENVEVGERQPRRLRKLELESPQQRGVGLEQRAPRLEAAPAREGFLHDPAEERGGIRCWHSQAWRRGGSDGRDIRADPAPRASLCQTRRPSLAKALTIVGLGGSLARSSKSRASLRVALEGAS